MITDEDKERVRQATDFVTLVSETVELKPRGQDYWGCCPFHQVFGIVLVHAPKVEMSSVMS